ncbi:MAG: PilN domain-containing protein [Proteobacteria bacterium]|nr:PilN domain-containing protein [Pseudomonadota bacterium]
MAKINLLPWRDELRAQRQREFYVMLAGAAIAAVFAVFVWWYWMGMRLDNQDARNAYLKDQIHQLDGKLTEIKQLESTKSKLLARKEIIEKLQASRSQMVHLFDELVKTIPDGVRLLDLKQNGDALTLDGVAQSNASVATYMRNLDASPWLTHPDLVKTEAKKDDKRERFDFGLTVKLTNPDEKAKEQEKAAAAAAANGMGKPASSPPAAEHAATAPPATPAAGQQGGKP